jgi:TP901 family phage tail tape measure protein
MAANAGSVRAELILANGDWKRKVAGAKEDMRGMGRQAKRTGKDIKAIQKASAAVAVGVAASIGAAAATAAKFEQSMARVKAVSGATDEQLSELEKTARDLGATTEFSASQAAEGMSFLAMAGFDVNEIVGAMPGVLNLASAAQVSMGQSADIVSNVMTGFGLAASETDSAVDVLVQTMRSANTDLPQLGQAMAYVAPVAKSLGLGIEETAAAVGKMSDAGIQGSKAGTSLRAALLSLANPTGQTEKAMDRLNVEVTDAEGNMKPLPELIGTIGGKLDGMTKAQKTQTIAQLVGTEAASGFLALIDEGQDGLSEYTKELENSAGAAEEVAETQRDTLMGAFKEFQSALEELGISIGNEFLPVFREIVDSATGLVRVLGDLNPDIVTTGLKMTGAAAGVALVASTVVRLAGKIRLLYAAMGPTGWVILGLSAIAGVAVGVNDAMNKSTEVTMEHYNELSKQQKEMQKTIDTFEGLRGKTKLTTDELLKYRDMQAEVQNTTDPTKIKELQEQMGKLQKKSGLSKDELKKLFKANDKLLEIAPKTKTAISEEGNAMAESADAAKALNKEKREEIRHELKLQALRAEANVQDHIADYQKAASDFNDQMSSYNSALIRQAEIEKNIRTIEADLSAAREAGNKKAVEVLERKLGIEKRNLGAQKDQVLAEAEEKEETRKTFKEKSNVLAKDKEVYAQMAQTVLQQAGLNSKIGEENKAIQAAIKKQKTKKREIIENAGGVDKLNEKQRETISEIDSTIDRYQKAGTKIDGLKTKQGDLNGQISDGKADAEDLGQELSNDEFKNLEFTGDNISDAKAITDELDKPVRKEVNIWQRVTRTITDVFSGGSSRGSILGGLQRHQGGVFDRDRSPEEFHAGGSPALRFSPPQHNEVDVRLLRNEMVLTEAQQASLFRQLDTAGASKQSGADFTETNALLANIDAAIRNSGGDTVIEINGREFARQTAEDMTEEQQRIEQRERRALGE